MEIMVEIQDITRFRIADELATYLGLTARPSIQVDNIVKMGHIIHAGDVPIRTYAVF